MHLTSPAADREWLLTNGLGGFAMGSADSSHSRRYHGLLIAAAAPPLHRVLCLHSIIETLHLPDGRTIHLTHHCFGADFQRHPQPFVAPNEIAVELPDRLTWRWDIDGITIRKIVYLEQGRNAVAIAYQVNGGDVKLSLRPMVSLRSFHHLVHAADQPPSVIVDTSESSTLRIQRFDYEMSLRWTAGEFTSDPQWWKNFAYAHDHDRGQDFIEDAWSPGYITPTNTQTTIEAELSRPLLRAQPPTLASSPPNQTQLNNLTAAATQFLVYGHRENVWSPSIIAGYPWFSDWGRDTMISIPGLLLVDGRHDLAAQILLTFARKMRNGLIPNCFDDGAGTALYNTVDASLWFVVVVGQLFNTTPVTATLPRRRHSPAPLGSEPRGEGKFPSPPGRGARGEGKLRSEGKRQYAPATNTILKETKTTLIKAAKQVIHNYRQGTDFGIRMDPADGLIIAGDGSHALTWMDAVRDGNTFTPRAGKPIEINALWLNALHTVAKLDESMTEGLTKLADKVAKSIAEKFWWPQRERLYDQIAIDNNGNEYPDESLRPNQLFAVSLPHCAFNKQQQRSIVAAARNDLLTPFGLRTLSPDHPDYRGRYEGDLLQRDGAYHQGTVWPWLLGPYCEAVLRSENNSAAAIQHIRECITPLLEDRHSACIGQIAEVYDGDPPHRPSGCPAQAWSVAELRRISAMINELTSTAE